MAYHATKCYWRYFSTCSFVTIIFNFYSIASNVLLLRRNWSCIIHVVFALLCGRPVVVLADPAKERF